MSWASSKDGVLTGGAEWRPARQATCRKGWCSRAAASGSEWCEEHDAQIATYRGEVTGEVVADLRTVGAPQPGEGTGAST
jgi:hypothetical protein